MQDESPLYVACNGGHLAVAKLLVNNGAKVAKGKEGGMMPLSIAAKNGHAEVAKFLIQAGAKPDQVTAEGCTPLWLAAKQGHLSVVKVRCSFATERVREKGENRIRTPVADLKPTCVLSDACISSVRHNITLLPLPSYSVVRDHASRVSALSYRCHHTVWSKTMPLGCLLSYRCHHTV
jgi:hypothetical protein